MLVYQRVCTQMTPVKCCILGRKMRCASSSNPQDPKCEETWFPAFSQIKTHRNYIIIYLYPIFTWICLFFIVNVGQYIIHGCYGYKCNYRRELCFGSLPLVVFSVAFPSQGIQHGLPVSAMPLIWGMAEPNRTGNPFGVGLHGNVANSLVWLVCVCVYICRWNPFQSLLNTPSPQGA